MAIVDYTVELKDVSTGGLKPDESIKLCVIPSGATIISHGIEQDSKFHVKYIVGNGNNAKGNRLRCSLRNPR